RRCQRGATPEDEVRPVLRLDAANALDDVRPNALERAPCKTFRAVGNNICCCRIEAVRHGIARRLWPEARPHIVGATTKQQIVALAMRGEECISAGGGPIGRAPVAVGEIVFIRRLLDHAVQGDMFHDPDLSHSVSFSASNFLLTWLGRECRRTICLLHQEDGQWWVGFELWIGFGGEEPVIYGEDWRVC